MTTDMHAGEIEPYAPAQAGQYQALLTMTPEQAKALDQQVRMCTEAVLREGTDYGVIPGTNGEKTLWRPGAQKLMQWFGLSFSCDRIEVERDDQGRKHGITYRATVARRLPDGTLDVKATCEGTADYDEDKFYQTAEDRQRKAETFERRMAEKDHRPARPTRWQGLPEYRADWNALMKRAQKRAIVGAVVDATAAGGIFSDREEDDRDPAPRDDGPSWYEQALETALTFTAKTDGQELWRETAAAARDGLCTPGQATHIQNRIGQRIKLLQTATVVDVEDLGQEPVHTPAVAETDPTQRAGHAATSPGTDSSTALYADGRSEDDLAAGALAGDGLSPDEPGTASNAQLTKLHTVFTKLGFDAAERDQKLKIAETITGRAPLTGPWQGRSSKNLSLTEASKLIDTLDGFGGRDALVAWIAGREQDDGSQ